MIITLHTPHPPPHHHQELYFHYKEPQINLWSCLNNNINIKDNINNKNNLNSANNNTTTQQQQQQPKNKPTSKQLGCDFIVISLVY